MQNTPSLNTPATDRDMVEWQLEGFGHVARLFKEIAAAKTLEGAQAMAASGAIAMAIASAKVDAYLDGAEAFITKTSAN